MSTSADVAISTVTSILIGTTIIGNSLVCAIIKRNRDMRIPINYLIVNLAVSDIIYSKFHVTELVYRYIPTHPKGLTGKMVCILRNGNLQWIGAASAVVTLVAITVERYYAVIYPHGNKGKLTIPKLKVFIPCCWIFSLVFNVPLFFMDNFVKEIHPNLCIFPALWMSKAYSVMWFALVFISSTLMIVLYSRVLYTLWFKRNDDSELTYQQQVGVNEEIHSFGPLSTSI